MVVIKAGIRWYPPPPTHYKYCQVFIKVRFVVTKLDIEYSNKQENIRVECVLPAC